VLLSYKQVRNILSLLIQFSCFELVALFQRMFAAESVPQCVCLLYVYLCGLPILRDLELNSSVVAYLSLV